MKKKPHASSCDENQQVIYDVIGPLLKTSQSVLEVGSGTGQHAVYFARRLPHLSWQTSELTEHHDGIHMWLDEAGLDNVLPPITLDVMQTDWPPLTVDALFTANTLHIMPWQAVEALFCNIHRVLKSGGRILVYGPFNYGGEFTSESNAKFDIWLKERNPLSGVRDFEAVNRLAQQAGLVLDEDYEMPANNRILSWRRLS